MKGIANFIITGMPTKEKLRLRIYVFCSNVNKLAQLTCLTDKGLICKQIMKFKAIIVLIIFFEKSWLICNQEIYQMTNFSIGTMWSLKLYTKF